MLNKLLRVTSKINRVRGLTARFPRNFSQENNGGNKPPGPPDKNKDIHANNIDSLLNTPSIKMESQESLPKTKKKNRHNRKKKKGRMLETQEKTEDDSQKILKKPTETTSSETNQIKRESENPRKAQNIERKNQSEKPQEKDTINKEILEMMETQEDLPKINVRRRPNLQSESKDGSTEQSSSDNKQSKQKKRFNRLQTSENEYQNKKFNQKKSRDMENDIDKFSSFEEVPIENLELSNDLWEDVLAEMYDPSESRNIVKDVIKKYRDDYQNVKKSDPLKVLRIDLTPKTYSIDENGEIILPKFEYVPDSFLEERIAQRKEKSDQFEINARYEYKKGTKQWNDLVSKTAEKYDKAILKSFYRGKEIPKNFDYENGERDKMLIDKKKEVLRAIIEKNPEILNLETNSVISLPDLNQEITPKRNRDSIKNQDLKDDDFLFDEKKTRTNKKRFSDFSDDEKFSKEDNSEEDIQKEEEEMLFTRQDLDDLIQKKIENSEELVTKDDLEKLVLLVKARQEHFYTEFPKVNHYGKQVEDLDIYHRHLRRIELSIYSQTANQTFKDWLENKKSIWKKVEELQASYPDKEIIITKQLKRKEGGEAEFNAIVQEIINEYSDNYAIYYDDTYRMMAQHLIKMEDLRLRVPEYQIIIKGEEFEIFKSDAEGGEIYRGQKMIDKFRPDLSGDDSTEFEKFNREIKVLRQIDIQNWKNNLSSLELKKVELAEKRAEEYELPDIPKERPHLGMMKIESAIQGKQSLELETKKAFPNKKAILNFMRNKPSKKAILKLKNSRKLETKRLKNSKKNDSAGFMSKMGVSGEYFKKEYERTFSDEISIEDRFEVRTTVAFLLEKSEEDFDRIKRFFISTLTMAMHARNLNPTTRRKARRNLQLHDESYWFDHFLLKLCQGFYNIRYFPKSREAVLFEVSQEDVNSLKFFKEVLFEAINSELPQIEPFDWNGQLQSFEKALELINHPKVNEQESTTLSIIRNGLESVKNNNSLILSMSKEMSAPGEIPQKSATLVDLMNYMAKKFTGINSSNKTNDPERALFDFSMDLSISQIRKDHLLGHSENHFPLFNSHAYFNMFLDQPDEPIYNENNKETPFERKPIRIQVISALQKAMNLRSRNRLPLEPLNQIIQDFIENQNVLDKLTRSKLENIEEAFEDFIGFCKDPNYMLKQNVISDTLGSQMKDNLREYNKMYVKFEDDLVSDFKKENKALLSDFLGIEDSNPQPILGNEFLDVLERIDDHELEFNFEFADKTSFNSKFSEFFGSQFDESYYLLKGTFFAEKITGFINKRKNQLNETQTKGIFKAAKCGLDLGLDDSTSFSKIADALINNMISENPNEIWKLELLNELQDSLISTRQLKTAILISDYLKEIPTLPSSIRLEQTFASEIETICQSFNSNESNRLLSLVKLYSISLETVLQSNLNTTCNLLSRSNEEEQIQICLDSGHSILLGLSSGKVLSCISNVIDSQIGNSNDFFLADMRLKVESLLVQLRRFVSLHPFFASSADSLSLIEDSSKYEILNSINYETKEKRIRESPLLTARGVLLDRLIPANTILHHFLFSTSQHAYQRDLMFLLDLKRNIEPLADFISPLSEDYRLQVETWLSVILDSPTILNEIQTEKGNIRELAEAVYSMKNSELNQSSANVNNLNPDSMIILLDWFSEHLLSKIDSNNYTPLKISDIISNLPEQSSDLVFLKSTNQLHSLISTSSEKSDFAETFALTCANCSKNSTFLRFKEDQFQEMQESFFKNHLFKSTHGIYSQILNVASFKLGDVEFFSESFHDPRLLPSNPILVKKQSFLFLMSLLRVQSDSLTLQKIKEEMAVEIMNCFPSDRNLFEVAIETKINPSKSFDLFEQKYMKPLYFSAFKEKMTMFIKGFLFGKTNEKLKTNKLSLLEENDQIFNPYDPLAEKILEDKNNLLEEIRFDSKGNIIENGNELVTNFDPKKYGEDPFRSLGELDLRAGSVINFNSSLSTLRPELVRAKIEALLSNMENIDWKDMFQRDSQQTFQNAIEQNYKLTDEEFWDYFKNYVDKEVYKVAQVRREYRRILEKQVEINRKNLKDGKPKSNFEDVAKIYYQSRPKWDSSPAREKFDQIIGDEKLFDEITGKRSWQQIPEPEEKGEEAGWFNAARMTGIDVEESIHQLDNSRRLKIEKGEKPEQGLESWNLIERLSRLSDRDMMNVMWRSAQNEDFPEKLDLTEREKTLVLEVGQDYFEMLDRKEKMDLARSTSVTVRQARELEMRVFEDVLRLDFITALKNKAPNTPLNIAESRFQETRDFIIHHSQDLFKTFLEKWNLKRTDNLNNHEGIFWIIEAYNQKLEETDSIKDGDFIDDINQKIKKIKGDESLFEDEKKKAKRQQTKFEMQSELRRILGIMNQIVCHDSVIEEIVCLNESGNILLNNDQSEDSSSSLSSEEIIDNLSQKKNTKFKFRSLKLDKSKSKDEKIAKKEIEINSLPDFEPVKKIMSDLCQQFEKELSNSKIVKETNIQKDLRRSALEDSEDLDNVFLDTRNETQIQNSTRLREIELEKTAIKIETFLFFVKSLKRHRKIQILEKELEQFEKDLTKELTEMETKINSLTEEERKKYNNLITLQRLRQEGAEGVQLFEFMTGFRDLQILYKHRKWAQTLEAYQEDRDNRLKEFKRVRSGDVLKSDEIIILQGVGLRQYLAYEIGISAFIGNAKIENEIRQQALKVNKKYGEELIPSELEVADIILGEVLNLKDEWWDRTPSIALLREDLADKMFPDADEIIRELKNTQEGQVLVNLYNYEDVKRDNDSMIEPQRGEDYTAYQDGAEYSTSVIFNKHYNDHKINTYSSRIAEYEEEDKQKYSCSPDDIQNFQKATVSSLMGPQKIEMEKDGVPEFIKNDKLLNPVEWENDLKSGNQKPENLMRELKLLNMKVKLIEEELKDLEKQKEIKYLNNTIRLDRAVRRLREQGGEPTQKDIQILMKKYGVLTDIESNAKDFYLNNNNITFDYKSSPAFKRYVHAKARLLSDYLLRFDPEFRRDFLKNKTLDKIEETLDNKKKMNSSNFKPSLSHLNPELFGNDNHGVLVRASSSLIGIDLPQSIFKATNYLSAGNIENHMLESINNFVNGIENQLGYQEGKIVKSKKTKKIQELDYFSKFQDVMQLKGHFSPEEQEAIFNLFNLDFGADEYELPLIRGSWTNENDTMTKKEFISALKNPTIENRLRLSDFLLRSVQNLNSLDENHEDYLKLVQNVYRARENFLSKRLPQFELKEGEEIHQTISEAIQFDETTSQGLNDLAEKLSSTNDYEHGKNLNDQQIESLSSNISSLNRDQISSAHFESFDSNLLNQKLLELLETFDLEEVGLDATFKETLQNLDQKRRELKKFKDTEKKIYNYDTKNLENTLELSEKGNKLSQSQKEESEIASYAPKTFQTLSRKDDSNNLAEQIVMVNSVQSQLQLNQNTQNENDLIIEVENVVWGKDHQLHKSLETRVSIGNSNIIQQSNDLENEDFSDDIFKFDDNVDKNPKEEKIKIIETIRELKKEDWKNHLKRSRENEEKENEIFEKDDPSLVPIIKMENEESRSRIISQMKKAQKKNPGIYSENLIEDLQDTKRRAIMTEDEVNRQIKEGGARVTANLMEEQIYPGDQLMDTNKILELLDIIDQDLGIVSDEKKLSAHILKMYYRNYYDIENESKRNVTDIEKISRSGYGFDLNMQLKSLTSVDKNYYDLYLKGVIDKKQFEKTILLRNECLSLLKSISQRDGTEKALSYIEESIKKVGIFNFANHLNPITEPCSVKEPETGNENIKELNEMIFYKSQKNLQEMKDEYRNEKVKAGINPNYNISKIQMMRNYKKLKRNQKQNKIQNLKNSKKEFEKVKHIRKKTDQDQKNNKSFIIKDIELIDESGTLKIDKEFEKTMAKTWSFNPGKSPRIDDFRNVIKVENKSKKFELLFKNLPQSMSNLHKCYLEAKAFEDVVESQKEIKKRLNQRGLDSPVDIERLVKDRIVEIGIGEHYLNPVDLVWDKEDLSSTLDKKITEENNFEYNLIYEEKVKNLVNVFGNIGKNQVSDDTSEIIVSQSKNSNPQNQQKTFNFIDSLSTKLENNTNPESNIESKNSMEMKSDNETIELVSPNELNKKYNSEIISKDIPVIQFNDEEKLNKQVLEIINDNDQKQKKKKKKKTENNEIENSQNKELVNKSVNVTSNKMIAENQETGEKILYVYGSDYMKKMPFMRSKTKILNQEVNSDKSNRLFEKKKYEYVYQNVQDEPIQNQEMNVSKSETSETNIQEESSTMIPIENETRKVYGMNIGKFDLTNEVNENLEAVRIILDYEQMAEEESDSEILEKLWDFKKQGLVSIKREKGFVTFEYKNEDLNVILTMDGMVPIGGFKKLSKDEKFMKDRFTSFNFVNYKEALWLQKFEKNRDPLDPNYVNPMLVQLNNEKFRQLADSIDGLIVPNLDVNRKLATPNSPTGIDQTPKTEEFYFLDQELAIKQDIIDPKLKKKFINKELKHSLDSEADKRVRAILNEEEIFDQRYYGTGSLIKKLGEKNMEKLKTIVENEGETLPINDSLQEHLKNHALHLENKEKKRRKKYNKRMLKKINNNKRILKKDAIRNEKNNLFNKGEMKYTTAEMEIHEKTEDLEDQFDNLNKSFQRDDEIFEDAKKIMPKKFEDRYFFNFSRKKKFNKNGEYLEKQIELTHNLDNRLLMDYEKLKIYLQKKFSKAPEVPWLERYLLENKMMKKTMNSKMFLEGYTPRKIVHPEETVDTRIWGLMSGDSHLVSSLKAKGIKLSPYLKHKLENRSFVGHFNEYELYHLTEELENDKYFNDMLLHPHDEMALQRKKRELREKIILTNKINKNRKKRKLKESLEDDSNNQEKNENFLYNSDNENLENEGEELQSESDNEIEDSTQNPEEFFKEQFGFEFFGSDEPIYQQEKLDYKPPEISPDMTNYAKARVLLRIKSLEEIKKDYETGARSFQFKRPELVKFSMIKNVLGKITEENKRQIPYILQDLVKKGMIEETNPTPIETYVRQFEELIEKLDTCKETEKLLVDTVLGENFDGLSQYDEAIDEIQRQDLVDEAFYIMFLGNDLNEFNEEEINNHNKMMKEFQKKIENTVERNDFEIEEIIDALKEIKHVDRQQFLAFIRKKDSSDELKEDLKKLKIKFDEMLIRKHQMRTYSEETPKSYIVNKMIHEYKAIQEEINKKNSGIKTRNLHKEPQNMKMMMNYYKAVADGLPQNLKFVKRMKQFFEKYKKIRLNSYFHSEKKQVMNAFENFMMNEFIKLRLIRDHQYSFAREMKKTIIKRPDGNVNRDYKDWLNALDIQYDNGEIEYEDQGTYEQRRRLHNPDDTTEELDQSDEEKLFEKNEIEKMTYRHRLPDGRYVISNNFNDKNRRVTKRLKEFFGRDHPALIFEGLLECEQRLSKQMRNRIYETTQRLLPGSLGKMTAEKMYYLTIGHPSITGEFDWMDGADPKDVRLQLFVGFFSPEDFYKPGETEIFQKRDQIKNMLLSKFAQKNQVTVETLQEIEKEILMDALYSRYLKIQQELFIRLYERLGFHSQTYVFEKVEKILNLLVFSNLHLFFDVSIESLKTSPAFETLSKQTEKLLEKSETKDFDLVFEMAFANEQLSSMNLENLQSNEKWSDKFNIEHVTELLRIYQKNEISLEALDQQFKTMEKNLISNEEKWSEEEFSQLKKSLTDLIKLIEEGSLNDYLDSGDLQHSLLSGSSNLGSAVERFIEKEISNIDPNLSIKGSGLVDEIFNEKDLDRIRNFGNEQIRLGLEPSHFSDQRDPFQEFFFNKYHDDVKLLFYKKNWNMSDDPNFTDYQNRAFRSMVRELGLVKDNFDTPILDPRPFNSASEMKEYLVNISKNLSSEANLQKSDLESQRQKEINEEEKDIIVGGRKIRSIESVSATVQAQLDGKLKISPESGIEDPEIRKDHEEFKNIYLEHAKASQKELKNLELEKQAEAEALKRKEETLNTSFFELEKVFKKYSQRVMHNISDNKQDTRFPLLRMLNELSTDNFNSLTQVRSLGDLKPSNFRAIFELYLMRRHPRVREVFELSGQNVDMIDSLSIDIQHKKTVEDLLLKGVDLKLPMIEEMARIYYSVSNSQFETSEAQILTTRTGKVHSPNQKTRIEELDPNFIMARRIVNSPFFESIKQEVQSPDAVRFLTSQELRANDRFKVNVFKNYDQIILEKDFTQRFG